MPTEPWQYILGTFVTVLLGYLTYRGARVTADRSREGVHRTADVQESAEAFDAWRELFEPMRTRLREQDEELKAIREDLRAERKDRTDKERADERDRAAAKRSVDQQIERLTERIDTLTLQLNEWKRLAKTIARWAGRLRDEVLRLGGTVPATPEELLTLQAIEDAEQQ